MRAWVLREYGEPRAVLDQALLPDPVPRAGQLLVAVEAVGLAFPDLLRVRGQYQVAQPLGTVPGVEFVGRVRSCGPDTSIAAGTRIMGATQIGDGVLADLAVVRELEACAVPEDMPARDAATLTVNYTTAYFALHTRAALRANEVVVVNGGSGGVGSAAIQLARAAGARVLADDLGAARTQACLDFGAHAAVDNAEQDLTGAIKEFSGGHGADVVIDAVGGDAFTACRRAIASEGRIVIVGFTSGVIPTLKLNQVILGNYTVMGVNAFFYTGIYRETMQRVLDLYQQGVLRPPVAEEAPFAEAPSVLARIAEGKIRGRAIVLIDG